MKYLVFPTDHNEPLKNSLKINIELAENVVFRRGRARLYFYGGYEEYEIRNVIRDGKDIYFIAGALVDQAKPDYLEKEEVGK